MSCVLPHAHIRAVQIKELVDTGKIGRVISTTMVSLSRLTIRFTVLIYYTDVSS